MHRKSETKDLARAETGAELQLRRQICRSEGYHDFDLEQSGACITNTIDLLCIDGARTLGA